MIRHRLQDEEDRDCGTVTRSVSDRYRVTLVLFSGRGGPAVVGVGASAGGRRHGGQQGGAGEAVGPAP